MSRAQAKVAERHMAVDDIVQVSSLAYFQVAPMQRAQEPIEPTIKNDVVDDTAHPRLGGNRGIRQCGRCGQWKSSTKRFGTKYFTPWLHIRTECLLHTRFGGFMVLAFVCQIALFFAPLMGQVPDLVPNIGNPNGPSSIWLSNDRKLLVTGGDDRAVRIWNVESKRIVKVLRGATNRITSVALSRDRKSVLATDYDNHLLRWELPNGAVREFLHTPDSLSAYPQLLGTQYVINIRKAHGSTIFEAYDITKGLRPITSAITLDGDASEATMDSFARFVAAGGRSAVLSITDLTTHRRGPLLEIPMADYPRPQFSPDGRMLAAVNDSDEIAVWRTDTGQRVYSGSCNNLPNSSQFYPCVIGFAGEGKELFIWHVTTTVWIDLRTGLIARTVQRLQPLETVNVQLSEETFLTATGAGVGRWDMTAQGPEYELRSGRTAISRVKFLDNDSVLATAGGYEDDSVALWRLADGRPIYQKRIEHPIASVSFTNNKDAYALSDNSGETRTVRFAAPETDSQLVNTRTSNAGLIEISGDGTTLAEGRYDAQARTSTVSIFDL